MRAVLIYTMLQSKKLNRKIEKTLKYIYIEEKINLKTKDKFNVICYVHF